MKEHPEKYGRPVLDTSNELERYVPANWWHKSSSHVREKWETVIPQ